jgi:DNA-binding NarL/FixJ family response regulator
VSRILVVDDHPLVRRGVLQVLSVDRPALVVEEAGSAEEALERIEAAPPALVLLDVNLPGRSGLSLLTEILARHPEMPVLVVSSFPESEYGPRSLELGARGYLSKRTASEDLVPAVDRVLAGGRYVSPALAEWLAGQLGKPSRPAPEVLSERERQVLKLVASGFSLKEIGERLGISEKSVASYRARLALKLGLSSAVELTRYALTRGLLD